MMQTTRASLLAALPFLGSCVFPTPYAEFDDLNSPPVLRAADAQPADSYVLVSEGSVQDGEQFTLSMDAAYDRDAEDVLEANWYSITEQRALVNTRTQLELIPGETPPRPTDDNPSPPQPLSDDHHVFRPIGGGRITLTFSPCERLAEINERRSEFLVQEAIGVFVLDGAPDPTSMAQPVPSEDRHVAQYVWVLDYSNIIATCEDLQ